VAYLVEKIVSDAISQAFKRSNNDSLVDIDINDTLIDGHERLIIEPVLENLKAISIDQKNETVAFGNNTPKAKQDPSPETSPIDQINESTASVASVSSIGKKLANQKKDPIVDCFSCTIV
jgi:hypothetical protein